MSASIRIFFIAFLFFGSLQQASAQNRWYFEQDTVDFDYIRYYTDKVIFKFLIEYRTLDLSFTDTEGADIPLTYQVNQTARVGVSGQAFGLGFNLALPLPASFRDVDRFGDPTVFDFQINQFFRRWGVDLTYQWYEGFFIDNPGDFGQNNGEGFVRDDLRVTKAFVNVFYTVSPEQYSFKAAYTQREKQIKSAGSVVWKASMERFGMSSDQATLLPDWFEGSDHSTGSGDLDRGVFWSLAFLPGYGHNYVFGDFYFNLAFFGGIALQSHYYRFGESDSFASRYNIAPEVNLRSAIIYDRGKFFAGASYFVQTSRFTLDNGLEITTNTTNARAFVGFRFQQGGIFKRRVLSFLY